MKETTLSERYEQSCPLCGCESAGYRIVKENRFVEVRQYIHTEENGACEFKFNKGDNL
jgi:hypothetical protein